MSRDMAWAVQKKVKVETTVGSSVEGRILRAKRIWLELFGVCKARAMNEELYSEALSKDFFLFTYET